MIFTRAQICCTSGQFEGSSFYCRGRHWKINTFSINDDEIHIIKVLCSESSHNLTPTFQILTRYEFSEYNNNFCTTLKNYADVYCKSAVYIFKVVFFQIFN